MSEYAPNLSDDDDDDTQEFSSQWNASFRDGLLFLIDCNESMFNKCGDETHFELAIKCVKNVMKNKIISSERDVLAVVFYATNKSKNAGDFKNVFVLQDLDQPSAERVQQIQTLLDGGPVEFANVYGHSKDYSLGDAFWACSMLFSNCTQKLGSKRIMLFTNNDEPHRNKIDLQRQAKKKADDLREAGIDLELMHMTKPGAGFDYVKFYKDCVFHADDEDTIQADASEKFDELLSRVRAKDHKKRSIGKVLFSLGKDLDMSVGIYNLVRTCTKPSAVKLYKTTNEEVKTANKSYIAETGEILMPQDVKRAAIYEGRKVSFETEELNEMKKLGPQGIRLLGFKPREKLKRYHHSRPAQFIYPDDGTVKGSCTLFTALLKKCLEKNVVAICVYAPRKNLAPRIVALLPQAEELDERNVQLTPSGFHVIFLPFADDFRALKLPEVVRANEAQIAKAKDVVKKLRFAFASESFENPALQKHYANLEALALESDQPDDPGDFTEPDTEAQERRAGKELKAFKDLLFPEGYNPASKKRATTGDAAAGKRSKIGAGDFSVEAEARAGRLEKLTVAILKEYVKANKITAGSKKAELISAINAHFGL